MSPVGEGNLTPTGVEGHQGWICQLHPAPDARLLRSPVNEQSHRDEEDERRQGDDDHDVDGSWKMKKSYKQLPGII